MKYQFIAEHQQEYPIKTLCRVLGVAVSGYYAWRRRAPSRQSQENTVLGERIARMYHSTRQVYQGAWVARAFMPCCERDQPALRAQAGGSAHARARPECQTTHASCPHHR